jgi:hypothetical protein
MQPLNPLRVQHICLGAGATPRKLPGFHQLDLEAIRFEELEQRNPEDAGGFQSDRFHAAFFQPRDNRVKIGGIGAELADWVGVTVGWDTDHVHVGMDIDPGSVRVDDMQRRLRGGDGDRERPVRRLVGLGCLFAFGSLL